MAIQAVTDSDVELAQQILSASDDEAPSTTGSSVVTGSPIYPHAVARYAEAALLKCDMPQQQAAELSLIRIGDLALVGLPGEVFVEFGFDIRRRSTSPFTAVVGLCGGSVGYLPTRKAFAEGGYETWRRPASWTAVGTGEAMVEEVYRCLSELVG